MPRVRSFTLNSIEFGQKTGVIRQSPAPSYNTSQGILPVFRHF